MTASATQTVRNFMSAFENFGIYAAMPHLADDLLFTNTAIPGNYGKRELLLTLTLLMEAMPDFRWNIEAIFEDEGKSDVSVTMFWTGTHTGPFRLSQLWEAGPDLAPTGMSVMVPDTLEFRVAADKIVEVHIASDEEGGLTEWLRQIGWRIELGWELDWSE